MSMEIAIHDKETQAFLRKAIQNVQQINDRNTRYVDLLSAIVFQDVMDHFKQEEGSEGAWTPWSDIYQKHMDRIGKGGNKILQDTGILRQSFRPGNYRAKYQGILWFNPAKTKSGFPYAAAHNIGGPKLPKRDFMWMSKDGLSKIAETSLRFLQG